ncbi:MAG: NRDE family protein [Betaproteobacteria bacterium]|nr:NRDE family protein [Betaproteobacteria bacterium]
MCLIAFAWKTHPDYPLIVAANRDEWRARPTAAAHWWTDAPHILAGRDLEAGGTWLGVTRNGRFAALTNFRDPSDKKPGAPSRGELVRAFLDSNDAPVPFLADLRSRAQRYAGFNLLVSDGESLACYHQREDALLPVPPGIHALSNHSLNEPWPKVERAKSLIGEAIGTFSAQTPRQPLSFDSLTEVLSDTSRPADDALANTGVGLEWERVLSPILIAGEKYGTRSSTLLSMHRSGEVQLRESTRDETGATSSSVDFSFDLKDARREAAAQ